LIVIKKNTKEIEVGMTKHARMVRFGPFRLWSVKNVLDWTSLPSNNES